MVDLEGKTWRILVPTRDSARWIGALAAHYRRAGLDPLFVYDARSRDDTLSILQAHGFEPAVYEGGGSDIVEGGIVEFGARVCGAPWMLRMDDDEFPSQALIDFLGGLDRSATADAYFVSTREAFSRGGCVYYSRQRCRYWCHAYGPALSPHLRLVKLARARFVSQLHSPGLEVDGKIAFAPQQAFHIHFSALLRGFEERLAKVRAYDAINPGMGWFYGEEYLPELLSLEAHRAGRDGMAQFAPLLDGLARPNGSAAVALGPDDARRFTAALGRKWLLYYQERGGNGFPMAASSGSPVGSYGLTPPPPLVIAPRRLMPLASEFGEFDFVARANFRGWLGAIAKREHEVVLMWGSSISPSDAIDLLRAVARNPMLREKESELSSRGSVGLMRLNRSARFWRKRLAVSLSFLPASFAGATLARAFRTVKS